MILAMACTTLQKFAEIGRAGAIELGIQTIYESLAILHEFITKGLEPEYHE